MVEPTKLNEGKPLIMNNLKGASLKIGAKGESYRTE